MNRYEKVMDNAEMKHFFTNELKQLSIGDLVLVNLGDSVTGITGRKANVDHLRLQV